MKLPEVLYPRYHVSSDSLGELGPQTNQEPALDPKEGSRRERNVDGLSWGLPIDRRLEGVPQLQRAIGALDSGGEAT